VDRSDDGGARHGGDIAGIRSHLDYIQRMGYTMIWPTPMLENNMPRYSYHGYAATDLYRIDPRFGSNEDYRQLVQAARQRGIGMIQDVVLNHIGSHHWWMQDMPAPEWPVFGQICPNPPRPYHAE
jgi:glycosidase